MPVPYGIYRSAADQVRRLEFERKRSKLFKSMQGAYEGTLDRMANTFAGSREQVLFKVLIDEDSDRVVGVHLMGDLPIFVAHDSADCWSRPDLYYLDDDFQTTVVAGVPPDDLGPLGQRWGNPLYRWDKLADEGFQWWVDRIRSTLRFVDWLRIDALRVGDETVSLTFRRVDGQVVADDLDAVAAAVDGGARLQSVEIELVA